MSFKLLAYVFGCLASLAVVVSLRSVRLRQILLLLVSYLLYLLWGPWFLSVLLFSSVCNYFLGAYLRSRVRLGRLWLGISSHSQRHCRGARSSAAGRLLEASWLDR